MSTPEPHIPAVLCFAGLDPTGGAGLQADIEKIVSMGGHPSPIATSLTVQDTHDVKALMPVDPCHVIAQARAVLADMPVAAVKIGPLGSLGIVDARHDILADCEGVPVVLDPIGRVGSGDVERTATRPCSHDRRAANVTRVSSIHLARTEADMTSSSREFERARQCIPGGVNSPVRAFRAVGGTPVFFERARGALLFDIDSRRYVDYVGTWGPAVVGHAHPRVVEAVREAATLGLSFGAPTVLESEMAEHVCALVPSMDKVRMVSSGTEATMSAIRLARGFTGRDAIVKFEGCYHGHADSLLVKAGSGALTFGVPTSPGVPAALAEQTLTLDFNDADSVREAFARFGDRIAAVIVEPIAGNMNCVPPVPGFLESLRKCCDEHGAVLIFDEVMTGFRVAPGGAQALYGVRPDLTTLGKVIGGGMPVGAFGGRGDIMDHTAPDGPVYQAGTLSGNPIAMTAGLTTLEIIGEEGFHDRLSATTVRLVDGLRERAAAAGVGLATNHVCGMFGLFFTDSAEVSGFADVMACDTDRFARFFHAMLDEGVYLAPSAFETGFVSSAHTGEHLETTFRAAERAFEMIAAHGAGTG